MIETVIKRNGTVEPFDSTKFNKLTRWSAEVSVNGENEVDWSQLALDAMKKLYNNCTTKEIIVALISSCLERTEEAYFYIAGKLQMSLLYKDVYSYNNAYPPHLYEHLERMIEKNLYLDFLKEYSEEEINELDSILDHSLDFKMTHSQINQCMNKYLISNKLTDEIFETPQFMNMRVALDVCHNEPNRVEAIKEYYNRLKNGELNLPTTMWANLGTPQKTGTSCLLLSTKDTIGSLTSGDHIANIMTVAGAGIGTVLFTRSKKDPIQKGRLEHLGKIPYYKLLQANIDATMQSGARRGAATTYINVLDPEIETLIHLRNPTSIPEEKVDGIDYAFSYNKTFVEKFKANEDWMLISYYYAPDLWEAMYEKDTVNFDILYNKYLNDETIPKKLVNTRQLVLDCLIEQLATGRLYEFNCTNANRHTPFKEPIVSSNLCNEIYLPTKPHSNVTELYKTHYDEGDGYVQTCNLASINLKRDYTDEEYLKLCYWALKTIDYVIDNSEYKLPQIGVTTKKFRSAGVSFINLAYYLASHKLLYTSESGKQRIHEISERHEYMLMKASLLISKERGNAEWIDKTRYPEGWLPIDTYSKAVDDIAPFTYKYDWEELRKEVIENKGLAHCCLSTIVPSESSSLVCNATNAIYPIRKPITTKTGSNSKNVFMAPEYEKYKDYYQIAWDVPDLDNIHVTAIVQKFISQGISFDDYNDHTKAETNSGKRLVKNWLARDKYGLKGKYYTNNKTQDNDDLFSKDVGCGSGGCTL